MRRRRRTKEGRRSRKERMIKTREPLTEFEKEHELTNSQTVKHKDTHANPHTHTNT